MQTDLALAGCSLALMVGYHLFAAWANRHTPGRTFQSVMEQARAAWTRAIMEDGNGILAVQTLRNSTMAATFLASTAVFLATGVLTLSAQGDKLEAAWQALDSYGAVGHDLWLIKMLAMLVDLFVVFFSFSMAIRFFHHVGYMINVPLAKGRRCATPTMVIAQMARAGRFYWLGMRGFFMLVPLVMWLFGPLLMFAATVVVVALLFRLDRTPAPEADDLDLPKPTPLKIARP